MTSEDLFMLMQTGTWFLLQGHVVRVTGMSIESGTANIKCWNVRCVERGPSTIDTHNINLFVRCR